MTNRTARNRPRADRAERKRVARNRAERMRVVRDRAEHMRVVRDRAERTRSRYASVRAFVERLNAQPYELFKPRHRPPLSSRQFSLSTRVQPLPRQQHSFDTYSTVASLAVFLDTRSTVVSPTSFFRHLFYRCLIGSISRYAFNLCLANAFLPVHATRCLLNCCQAAFASSPVVIPLLAFSRCQRSVASSPVVVPMSPVIRCQRAVVLHPLSGSGVERALCPLFRILVGRMDAKRK